MMGTAGRDAGASRCSPRPLAEHRRAACATTGEDGWRRISPPVPL